MWLKNAPGEKGIQKVRALGAAGDKLLLRGDGRISGASAAEKNLTFRSQAARMASTLHAARPFQSVSTVVYRYLGICNSYTAVIYRHLVSRVDDLPSLGWVVSADGLGSRFRDTDGNHPLHVPRDRSRRHAIQVPIVGMAEGSC
jgi:hypothetical protein